MIPATRPADGFADPAALIASVRNGRRSLSVTDEPDLLDSGPVDAIADILLAVLVDTNPDDIETGIWGASDIVDVILNSARIHALGDHANLLDVVGTEARRTLGIEEAS